MRRLIAVSILLILAALAVPQMRTLPWDKGPGVALSTGWSRLMGGVPAKDGIVGGMGDGARILATKSRMRGVRQALGLYVARRGMPDADGLADALGQGTSVDAWGRPLEFQPPTATDKGWLRSYGPDGVPSKDDIVVILDPADFR